MLSHKTRQELNNNWGDKANSMNCFVEVKFIDEQSDWACYVYALNPEDQNTIACIIDGNCLETCEWTLKELYLTYNKQGEYPVIDQEFKRIRTAQLFKRLNEQR